MCFRAPLPHALPRLPNKNRKILRVRDDADHRSQILETLKGDLCANPKVLMSCENILRTTWSWEYLPWEKLDAAAVILLCHTMAAAAWNLMPVPRKRCWWALFARNTPCHG